MLGIVALTLQAITAPAAPQMLPELPGRNGQFVFMQMTYAIRDRARLTAKAWADCAIAQAVKHEWYNGETMDSAVGTSVKECSRYEAYYDADISYIKERGFYVIGLPDVEMQRSYVINDAKRALAYSRQHRR